MLITEEKQSIKDRLIRAIESHRSLCWDYEVMNQYYVRDDLGKRYGRLNDGSISSRRTVSFIRYWDAACRYILDILTESTNWDERVDVWGIPHLVNNSLGAWLRMSGDNYRCSRCKSPLYLATNARHPSQLVDASYTPIFSFFCPRCSSPPVFAHVNI